MNIEYIKKHGRYVGFCSIHGYIYNVNSEYYSILNGEVIKVGYSTLKLEVV